MPIKTFRHPSTDTVLMTIIEPDETTVVTGQGEQLLFVGEWEAFVGDSVRGRPALTAFGRSIFLNEPDSKRLIASLDGDLLLDHRSSLPTPVGTIREMEVFRYGNGRLLVCSDGRSPMALALGAIFALIDEEQQRRDDEAWEYPEDDMDEDDYL